MMKLRQPAVTLLLLVLAITSAIAVEGRSRVSTLRSLVAVRATNPRAKVACEKTYAACLLTENSAKATLEVCSKAAAKGACADLNPDLCTLARDKKLQKGAEIFCSTAEPYKVETKQETAKEVGGEADADGSNAKPAAGAKIDLEKELGKCPLNEWSSPADLEAWMTKLKAVEPKLGKGKDDQTIPPEGEEKEDGELFGKKEKELFDALQAHSEKLKKTFDKAKYEQASKAAAALMENEVLKKLGKCLHTVVAQTPDKNFVDGDASEFEIFINVCEDATTEQLKELPREADGFKISLSAGCKQDMATARGGDELFMPQMLSVGTLGGFFVDNAGVTYAVTNKHVVENDGAADDAHNGRWVMKWNGLYHLGNVVRSRDNTDSALVQILRGNTPCEQNDSPLGRVAMDNAPHVPALHDVVWKSGRTTGVTVGIIRAIGNNDYGAGVGSIQVQAFNPRGFWPRNRQFCRGGDSGSFIMYTNVGTQTHHPVALLSKTYHDAERWYDAVPGLGPSVQMVNAERTIGALLPAVLADLGAGAFPGLTYC